MLCGDIVPLLSRILENGESGEHVDKEISGALLEYNASENNAC